MNSITKEILEKVVGQSDFEGAFNIRQDCQSVGLSSSKDIEVVKKANGKGLEVYIKPNTVNGKVFVPACITKSGINDIVENDFYIGEGAEVFIVAGCGINSTDDELSVHNSHHRFFVGKNSKCKYTERHIGLGILNNFNRIMNAVTDIKMDENSFLDMSLAQISGVSSTNRKTFANLDTGASLVVKERLLTEFEQNAISSFIINLNGINSNVNLISRTVAKDKSYQEFTSQIVGNCLCKGHSECDAIISGNAKVVATPSLIANNVDASLIHEAAISKVAGEQLQKLQSLGLTEKQAEEKIINGFLK